VDAILGKVKEERPVIKSLTAHLQQKTIAYATAGSDTPRLWTVRSAQSLLAALANADRGEVVSALAHAPIETSEAAMAQTRHGRSIRDSRITTGSRTCC